MTVLKRAARTSLAIVCILVARAVPLSAQASAKTWAGGATGGIAANLQGGDTFAMVWTMFWRYQRPAVGIEWSVPVYQQWITIDPQSGERARSVTLAPEFTLQWRHPFPGVTLFAGAGAGWLIPLNESSLSGASANAVLGLRFRISRALDGRLETRSRWIEGNPTAELAVGLEMWR